MKSKTLSIIGNLKTAFLIIIVCFSLSAITLTVKAQNLASNQRQAIQQDLRHLTPNNALNVPNNAKPLKDKKVSIKLEVLKPKVLFKNGESRFIKSIDYPKSALEQNINGVVEVYFEVGQNGYASDIRILKSLSYDCDQAVLKAIHKAKFIPGMVDGQAVKARCILPVYFGLDPAKEDPKSLAETLPDTVLQPVYDNSHNWLDRTVSYKKGKVNFTRSIIYPQDAIDQNVEGVVKAFFVVEPNGHTSNIRILKSLNYECDQAVIKAIHQAKFIPGMIDGQNVRVHCILPVYFGLKNSK